MVSNVEMELRTENANHDVWEAGERIVVSVLADSDTAVREDEKPEEEEEDADPTEHAIHSSVVLRRACIRPLLSLARMGERLSSPSHLHGRSSSSKSFACAAFLPMAARSSSSVPRGKSGPFMLATTSENATLRDWTANSL